MITGNVAKDALSLISPYIPHLVQGSIPSLTGPSAEQYKRAKSLWRYIKSKFEITAVSRRIIEDLKSKPHNAQLKAFFQYQLSQFIQKDKELTLKVQQILYTC